MITANTIYWIKTRPKESGISCGERREVNIINTFRHFKKVCTHKHWVFYYCCKVGIPFQGLIHDLSKFSPTEFWESVKYYQGTSSPLDA